MQKINIFSEKWCDIVFKDRPKEYGAYELRKSSSKRHRTAIIVTLIFFLLAFSAPGLIKSIIPESREVNVEVTNLANIDLEKNKNKEIEQPKIEQEVVQKIKSTIKFTPPVIKDDAEVKDEEIMKTQDEVTDSKLSVSTSDVKGNSEAADAVDLADLQQQQTEVVEEAVEAPFSIVEQMPEFPGGDAARVKYLSQNIKYPVIARESGITGTVYMTFVVSKTGKISNVKVLRGIGGGCDEEAIRVIQAMPDWIPGRQNGKPVSVQYNLPIKFTLAG
jgi:periplasmic protein TonB